MKYRRAKRDRLRALTSEILPYEVPLPFGITRMYEFLRRLDFAWEYPHSFSVIDRRLGRSEKLWLSLIFDPIKLGNGILTGENEGRDRRRVFTLSDSGGKGCDLRHPYKFRSRRNNGKSRNLAVPHPHSMVQMAYFVHEFRDSILYFTNRSNYSIRYPHRVARLQTRRGSVFDGVKDRESFGVEQSDLEYSYVSSYFSYRRYNNINRFYSSPEFQACERKYPRLIRADVAKCFDSVYTHTVSWVTNGVYASKKMQTKVAKTFGGRFDHLMQYLNYAETSGIIIGPELSRVFAEIILQEVDVRVERELAEKGLERGKNYEIMRYVDDYFVFLADAQKTELVEETLATQLAVFKLHLNDEKQRHFDTPLASNMSIAKVRIREALKQRTQCDYDLGGKSGKPTLHFSAKLAIIDYKALLIDTELKHGELANSYLYELGRRRDKTVRRYRKYIKHISETADLRALHRARVLMIRYLVQVLDVAVFIYSGAPSVSHSVKLTRMVAASVGELELNEFGMLENRQFRGRIEREIVAQLAAVKDERSLGAHTLLLIDCLIYLNPEIPEQTLLSILNRRGTKVENLDAFGVLTLLRRFSGPSIAGNSDLKAQLLKRAKFLIADGRHHQEGEASRAILMLSLPTFPGARPEEIADAMGDGYSPGSVISLQASQRDASMFSWTASDNYHERLLLKSTQFVY